MYYPTKDSTLSEKTRYQASKDIALRSMTGTYIYMLIWFAMIVPSEFYITAPKHCLFITLILTLFSAIRIAMVFNFEKIYGYNSNLWRNLFSPIVWCPALTWGIMCAISFINPIYQDISLPLIISTSGLVGGGVIATLPSRPLTIGLISSFLVPSIFLTFLNSGYDLTIKLMFIIYWVGLVGVTRKPYNTYWSNLRHSETLEKLNKIDGLTGLNNRRYFDQSLTRELKQAQRTKTELSLILLDIDHFKMINDQHGHLIGDDCLRRVAIALKNSIKRETDIVARYGGEEFAIILPGNDKKTGLQVAEDIRKTIEELDPVYGETHCPLTISAGIVTLQPTQRDTEETIINSADAALYRAKENGRNQVAN